MVDALQTFTWFLLLFSLTCAFRSQQASGTEAVVGFHRPNATASVWRVNPNKQGPDLNIGVIQVRLSNWTEKPTTALPPQPPSREFVATNIPKGQRNRNWKRRQQAGSVNVRRAQLTPYDASPEQDDDSTFRIGRFVDPDSAFAYTIVAISFGLVGILALIYGILTVLSNRSKKRMYLESGGDMLYQHPSELERLYHRQHDRRDMEWKRPPLYAPPPPPPSVPPPVPPSMPPPPAPAPPPPPYVRRKMPSNVAEAQAEREFRLQLLKRQISESTTSRSRTGSI